MALQTPPPNIFPARFSNLNHIYLFYQVVFVKQIDICSNKRETNGLEPFTTLSLRIDLGLVGSTEGGTRRAEDAYGTPTQSHITASILVYEDNNSLVESKSISKMGYYRVRSASMHRACESLQSTTRPKIEETARSLTASGRRWTNFKDLKDLHLQARTRIWPRLSDMCHIRSTAEAGGTVCGQRRCTARATACSPPPGRSLPRVSALAG